MVNQNLFHYELWLTLIYFNIIKEIRWAPSGPLVFKLSLKPDYGVKGITVLSYIVSSCMYIYKSIWIKYVKTKGKKTVWNTMI